MKKVNEEDYLDSLLKSMNNKVEESDDDKAERLLKEQIKEAVQKTHLQQDEMELEYSEPAVSEIKIENEDIITKNIDTLQEQASPESEEKVAAEDLAAVSDTENNTTSENDMNESTPIQLGEEYSHLFEPESSDFKISDIPDRDPEELSQSEIERLANMDLDDFLNENEAESVSVSSLLGSGETPNKQDTNNVENIIPTATSPVKDILDDPATNEMSVTGTSVTETSGTRTSGTGTSATGIDGTATDMVTGAANLAGDALGALGGLAQEISTESAAVAAAAASLGEAVNPKDKKKEKKAKKPKKSKDNKDTSDKDPKNKKAGKKFNLLEFIKNIFFEEIESPEKISDKELVEPKDENERVLRELYGDTTDTEYDDESVPEEKSKKGFFSKKGKKTKNVEESSEEDEDDAEYELERQNNKKAKKEKKAADKAKKKEAAEAKKAKKPPKPKKEPKPKKPKKPKKPTRPQDMIKIKPGSLILFIMFVSGIVIFVQISNTAFQYQNSVSKANFYYQSGNYEKSYQYLQGVELKEADKHLYEQVITIMYLQKHYSSYEHYVELGMGVEALDSLIKGVSRYYEFNNKAKELGVSEQYDAIRVELVDALKTTFAISEAKAISYAALADEDFVQYYYTLESYGGMIKNDSNN